MLSDFIGRPLKSAMGNKLGFGVRKHSNPVDLTSDSDDEDHQIPKSFKRESISLDEEEDDDAAVRPGLIIIPDDDDDGEDEVEQVLDDDEVIAVGNFPHARTRRSVTPMRFGHKRHLDSFQNSHGLWLTPGSGWDLPNGDFFRIFNITQHNYRIAINGRRFRRNHAIIDMMPKQRNEVTAILQVPEGVPSPHVGEYLEEICPDDLAIARKIVLSNYPFSKFSTDTPFRDDDHSFRDGFLVKYPGKNLKEFQMKRHVSDHERVVCRWKYIEYRDQSGKLLQEGAIIPVSEVEADPTCRMSDVLKTKKWHGTYEDLEGAMPNQIHAQVDATPRKRKSRTDVHDMTDRTREMSLGARKSGVISRAESIEETEVYGVKRTRRSSAHGDPIEEVEARYERRQVFFTMSALPPKKPISSQPPVSEPDITFADICCGCGGWTRGATMAGLKPVWLLDHWDRACETVRRNWPNARILKWDINKFCGRSGKPWMRVPVLHISFPCQTYSPAHTHAGKNDDANSAAGYSVIPILQKVRPRVVTFEQTSGLYEHHQESFRAMVHQVTASNYGIRWKIMYANDQGGYQKRKRLIMLASCPGEPLPPFPEATHGPPGSGLVPYPTIRQALRKARGTTEEHMLQHTVKDRAPYDENKLLTQAITCSGGDGDLHPNGTRSFTCLELSILQGFDRFHKFVNATKTDLRKLIGNAVPSMLSEAVNKEVVKSIRKRDKEIAAYRPPTVELD